jgi:hypothetical protein
MSLSTLGSPIVSAMPAAAASSSSAGSSAPRCASAIAVQPTCMMSALFIRPACWALSA